MYLLSSPLFFCPFLYFYPLLHIPCLPSLLRSHLFILLLFSIQFSVLHSLVQRAWPVPQFNVICTRDYLISPEIEGKCWWCSGHESDYPQSLCRLILMYLPPQLRWTRWDVCVAVSDDVSCLTLSLGPVERLLFLQIELAFMNKAITQFVYNKWFISRQTTFNCRLQFLDLWHWHGLHRNCVPLLPELCEYVRSDGVEGKNVWKSGLLCVLAQSPLFF